MSCVYHSEEAENQFMKDPKRATLGDGNRQRDVDVSDVAAREANRVGKATPLSIGSVRQQPGI